MGLSGASDNLPEDLCQIWAGLPRVVRQRSRPRYLCSKASNDTSVSLFSLAARVTLLEADVVELRSAAAASPFNI